MMIHIKPKTILLIVTGVGMVVTAYLAARKAPDAQKKKEEALKAKREKTGDPNAQLTYMESIQAQFGSYAPAIISGLVTIGSLTGSEIINKNNLQKAEKSLDDFKEMTDKLSGKGTSKVIERAVEQKKTDEKKHKPWEKKEEFRVVFQGHSIQFESTRADVIEAIYEANRLFHGKGCLTFNEFLGFLGQEPVGKEGDERGWEIYIGDTVYGYSWIDFGLKECEDEWNITEIYMACYPHFLDEDDCRDELEDGCGKYSLGDGGPRDE